VKSSLRLDFTVYTNFLFKKKVGQRKVHTHLRPYGLRCVCISGLTARNAKKKVRPHLLGRKAQEMLVQPTAAKEKKIGLPSNAKTSRNCWDLHGRVI